MLKTGLPDITASRHVTLLLRTSEAASDSCMGGAATSLQDMLQQTNALAMSYADHCIQTCLLQNWHVCTITVQQCGNLHISGHYMAEHLNKPTHSNDWPPREQKPNVSLADHPDNNPGTTTTNAPTLQQWYNDSIPMDDTHCWAHPYDRSWNCWTHCSRRSQIARGVSPVAPHGKAHLPQKIMQSNRRNSSGTHSGTISDDQTQPV